MFVIGERDAGPVIRRWQGRCIIMEERDVKMDLREPDGVRSSYEAPEATVVPVRLEDRVLGCNFSTISVCELTE